MLTPTCVWLARPAVIVALDSLFGEPIDSYVNGSQVWLREDGPAGITLEWRLHPVAGFERPEGVDTYELFSTVGLALATGTTPPAPLERLWDGLEAFPAYGDETEPALLAAAAAEAIGLAPDAVGLVDHDVIADEWERRRRDLSITAALLAQCRSAPGR